MRSVQDKFANKSNHDRLIRQFYESHLQTSDGTVHDSFATDKDELNDNLPAMVTPSRTSLGCSAVDFVIAAGEIGSDQFPLTHFKVMRSCNLPIAIN